MNKFFGIFGFVFCFFAFGCSFQSPPIATTDAGPQLVDDAALPMTDAGETGGFQWRDCSGEHYSRLQIQVNDEIANAQLGPCATGWDPVLLSVTLPDGSIGNLFVDGQDIDQLIPATWGGEAHVGAHCAATDTWYDGWSLDRTAASYGFMTFLWRGEHRADVSTSVMTMPSPNGPRLQVPIQGGAPGCE